MIQAIIPDIYRPPLELWLKISHLVLLLEEITDANIKDFAGKRMQDDLQVARMVFGDPGVKEWLANIKKLQNQKVLKS